MPPGKPEPRKAWLPENPLGGAAVFKTGAFDGLLDGAVIVGAFDRHLFAARLTSTTASGTAALMALVIAFAQPSQVMPKTR